jgi:hypothetical protein
MSFSPRASVIADTWTLVELPNRYQMSCSACRVGPFVSYWFQQVLVFRGGILVLEQDTIGPLFCGHNREPGSHAMPWDPIPAMVGIQAGTDSVRLPHHLLSYVGFVHEIRRHVVAGLPLGRVPSRPYNPNLNPRL